MFPPNSTLAISYEEAASRHPVGGVSFVRDMWSAIRPVKTAQEELVTYLGERDKAQGETRTPLEIAAKAMSDIDLAIRETMSRLQQLTAQPGIERAVAADTIEKRQNTPVTPQELVGVLQKQDVWTGAYWPATLGEWRTALQLPEPASKETILEALSRKFEEIQSANLKLWATRTVDGYRADGARIRAIKRLVAEKPSDPMTLRVATNLLGLFESHPTLAPKWNPSFDTITTLRVSNKALAGEALPSRIKILNWGKNPSTKGDILFDEKSIAAMAVAQRATGFDKVALDFEHNTVPGSTEFERTSEPRTVAGYGKPVAVRGDGLYLDSMEWTPAGQAHSRNFADLSPAVITDKERRVCMVHSCALVRNGAVHDLSFFKAAGITLHA